MLSTARRARGDAMSVRLGGHAYDPTVSQSSRGRSEQLGAPAHPGLPGGRSLFAITLVHSIAEFSAWITVLVVAFDRGGPAATGLAVAAQLVPAGIMAPVVTAAGDRFPRHVVLGTAFSTLALTSAALAASLSAGAPLAVVYVFAALFTVACSATPATVASLLVHHARTPIELMRWNISRSFVRAAGSLIGPLLTALALAVLAPSAVFVALAVICAATALVVAVRLPHDDRERSDLRLRTILVDSLDGVRYVLGQSGPRRTVGFIATTELVMGTFDVVFVAVAFDQLDLGGSATALLTAAFAAGALGSSVFASRRTGWTLTTLTSIGVLLLTVPLVVIAEPDVLVPVLLIVAVLGAGHALVEIGSQTLLQRVSSEHMTSRSFGALDSSSLVAAAIGAAIAGLVIDGSDLRAAVVTIGLGGGVVLLAAAQMLRRPERRSEAADPDLVDDLRTVAFLDPLPLPTLERLVNGLSRRSVGSGHDLVVQGEHGQEFFVLLDGAVDVIVDGAVVARLEAPASFGEVALLHDEVRMATVTAATPCEVAVIEQAAFLDAIRRTASSHREALDTAQRYRRARND